MGKRIIIKGADFSENGFSFPNVLTLSESDCTIANCGIIYTDGTLSADTFTEWKSSDFISIDGLTELTFSNIHTGVSFGLAFYSSNNVSGYISGVKGDSNLIGTTMNIPSGVKYIRFCSYNLDPTTLILQ